MIKNKFLNGLQLFTLCTLVSITSCNKEEDKLSTEKIAKEKKEDVKVDDIKVDEEKDTKEYIELHTSLDLDNSIPLTAKSIKGEEENIWIDLNNNNKRDTNEGIENGKAYILKSKKIRIYGKISELDCSNVKLTKIDISNNKTIEKLKCTYNNETLTELNISNNETLTELDCSMNKISNLILENNIALQKINCSNNPLQNLDLDKNNTELKTLFCIGSEIKNINLSNSPKINFIDCTNNNITNLDVTKCEELEELTCNHNPHIKKLDISKNSKLRKLSAGQDIIIECLKVSESQKTILDDWSQTKFSVHVSTEYSVSGCE